MVLKTPVGLRLRSLTPRGAEVWVPDHFYSEAAAGLRRVLALRLKDREAVEAALAEGLAAPYRRAEIKPLVPYAWHYRHNLSIADAIYVVLARALRAPLVTADVRLANAPGLPVRTITP